MKQLLTKNGGASPRVFACPNLQHAICATVAATLLCLLPAYAQTDNFDDGNDNGWTRFNPLTVVGAPATYSFPNGGYRFEAPAPAIGNAGPARAFSYRAEVSYTDFFTAVDVVDWNNDVNQAFGILARAGNVGLGTTTGYVFNYNPRQTGSRPGGQLQINRATNEAEDGTLATANLTLIPGHSYRFVFIGEGNVLRGYLYDLADLTVPLAVITADGDVDDRALSYPEGFSGLFVFSRGSATDEASIGDVTFDNYVAMVAPPETPPLPATRHGIAGTPQVIDRTPASNANFHPAEEGIEFSATTFSGNAADITSVRLFLNGSEVSNLDVEAEAGQVQVRFDGLRANAVYHAEVQLTAEAGLSRSTEWIFDTFTHAFLDENRVIEAEDYNFEGGQFFNNPTPSGLDEFGSAINFDEGYVYRAGNPGVDYSVQAATLPATDSYRPFDYVRTPVVNDTLRPGHIAEGVLGYHIFETESGDWYNYTREFAPGAYRVSLRAASRVAQTIHLLEVTGDRTQPDQTTEPLGVFLVPNTVRTDGFRYIPLTDENGAVKTIELSGERTLRLLIGTPMVDGEPVPFANRLTGYLNYMLLAEAPAQPEISVVSAATVDGPYTLDATAVVDFETSTITIPRPGESRFFRLLLPGAGTGQVTIETFGIEEAVLKLEYKLE